MKLFYLLFLFGITGKIYGQAMTELAQASSFMQSAQINFEENKGQVLDTEAQVAAYVKYHYRQGGTNVFMLPTGIAYQFSKVHFPEGYNKEQSKKELTETYLKEQQELAQQIYTETYRMDMNLVDANPKAQIIAEGKSNDYTNYYNHNSLGVYNFKKLTYKEVYPGIDWVIYTTEKGLKYDFIVQPGADPNQIQLEFKHHEDLRINKDGSFTLSNAMGTITEQAPISFQGEKKVRTNFVLDGAVIHFNLGTYDKNRVLVIDPNLVWTVNYGGGGGIGMDGVVDNLNNVYLIGFTSATSNIASGGHQNTNGGGTDAFIAKFNSSGVRQWASYYGGSGSDIARGCAVDNANNVYIVGNTSSTNNIASSGAQNTYGGGLEDGFVVKFNSNGVRQWGSYYGGTSSDQSWGCAVDNANNIYMVGSTLSSTNIALGGHQNSRSGNFDAFMVKFSNNGVRQWGSYYGGTFRDVAFDCAIDNANNIYLVGETESSNNINFGSFTTSYGGGNGDAYIAKFNSNGVGQWGHYYGGANEDKAHSCAIDNGNNIFLVGETASNNLLMSGHQTTYGGGATDAFIAKYNDNGHRQWESYYGASGSDWGYACTTDNLNNVYLAGFTSSIDSIASGGYQIINGGSEDAFITKFSNLGLREWSSYYGGTSIDRGFGCVTDNLNDVYLVGWESGNPFITKFGGTICLSTYDTITPIACTNYTYNGQVYTSSGIYIDTLTNALGCDSVVTLNLTINSPTSGVDVQTACSSYTWIDGNTYTSSNNTATHTLTNALGCDSVVTLNLTINNPTSGVDVQTACSSYIWIDGNTYTSSNNTATHTLTNAAGCDSVVTLNLTINSPTSGVDVQTACSSYTWMDGNTYTSSNNTATHTLTNAAGCDSVVTLNLTINNPTSGVDVQTACSSYTWMDGNTYTSSNNTATHTLTNALGCDSVVTLNLTINNPTSGVDVQTVCSSYTWIDGNTYTSSNNTATHTLTNALGCDSVVTLNLTINTIDTMLSLNGLTLTANQSGASYQWIDCNNGNTSIVGATNQSFTPTANGNYGVIINFNNCLDTSSCFNIIVNGLSSTEYALGVRVFPNPTIGKLSLVLDEVIEEGTACLVDVNGRMLIETVLTGQQTVQWNLNKLPTAIYFLTIKTKEGTYTKKIIKQ
ncbi:DUF7948 domain-containing protein [Aureispira anguillae]|uniref:SBBP repeat-containing protein n=1 Tax=Aureispira anguillae TaxID=2864201 RepID=A0A915YBG0_9BACT|nr:SBBP repeat-containing protein [Aureispira anguillae]BDS10006.1 SBBP repeat-containing protein [Aureispira anguillae]